MIVLYTPYDLEQLKTGGKPRSSRWPATRHAWLLIHNTCAACGTKYMLEVHHLKPFHLHPELELEPTNFLTLCEKHDCHIRVGHAYDWSLFNPAAIQDAMIELDRVLAIRKQQYRPKTMMPNMLIDIASETDVL